MSRTLLFTSAVALLAAGAASAEDRPPLDKDYVIQVVPRCHALSKYVELGEKRAQNEQVKEFARKLVKEHKTMAEQFTKAMEDQKVAVVAGLEKPAREELDRLEKLEGAPFDQALLNRIVEDHETVIRMCEAQAEKGNDAKLRDFAKNHLPKMKEHVKEAKELAAKVKG